MAWNLSLKHGYFDIDYKTDFLFVWPVRVSGSWAAARVARTGQETCHDYQGANIDCVGTGQDGEFQTGLAWPNPRFVDNNDGTVTDVLTGLIWLKDANCFGNRTWTNALIEANTLATGSCGLTDSSEAGDWRLPNVRELESLIDFGHHSPALSDSTGTSQWTEGDPFTNVTQTFYWTSSTNLFNKEFAWNVYLKSGYVDTKYKTNSDKAVWPVRN